jgi:3-hydroxybutyryl-CoA dehydrogenase
MPIQKIGVLGAGLMGSGIAQVAAVNGFDVMLVEVESELVSKGLANIEKSLAKFVEKNTLAAADRDAALQRLRGTTDYAMLAEADIVIEAIVENLNVKREVYARLDQGCQPSAIFASNTSSLAVTEMMTATSAARQTRFVGMHFFNPVPMMKLVEVIRTILTDDAVYQEVCALGERFGKTVVKAPDKTGFIVNRLLVPYMLDAIRVLEEGLASTVDIDNAMKLGCGYPMGPLTLADFVGLDTTYAIANIMFDEFKEKRFAPPTLLKRMVLAGLFGRKSGKGFYDYSEAKNPAPTKLV